MVQIVVHQLVPKLNQKKLRPENKKYSHLADGGGSDLAGTLRPEKKYSCLACYVFQRVQITTGKNYDRKKKVQSSRLTGHFFRRVQITTRKIYDRKNKRYSRLANGGGSDLAGTLESEKKNVQSSGRLCFSAGSNYNRKKLRPEKKVQSSGRQLETGKNTSGKKGTVVWLSVGGQNTKHNTHHRHNNQQDVW